MSSMDYERGNQANGCLDRFFKLTKHGTSVKTEIFAGITMFIASVYILAVIPNLLSVSGMPHGSASGCNFNNCLCDNANRFCC